MAAPSIRTTANTVANGTGAQTAVLVGAATGDLITIFVTLTTDNNLVTAPTVTATNGGANVVGSTLTLDVDHLSGTQRILIWSAVMQSTPTVSATVTTTGTWPSSGNRRMGATCITPAANEGWNTTTARLLRSGTGNTNPGSGNPWGITLGGSPGTRPDYAITASVSTGTPASAYTADWNDDNTYSNTAPDGQSIYSQASNSHQTHHNVSAGGVVAPHTGTGLHIDSLSFSVGRTSVTAAGGAVYVTYSLIKPAGARGNQIAKGTGAGTAIRIAGARGNQIAKGTGSGIKFAGIRAAGARGNAIAKGAGGATAIKLAGARGRAVAKGGGSITVVRKAGARGNSVSSGFTFGAAVVHVAGARGRAVVKGAGAGHISVHIAGARGRAVAKGTGAGLRVLLVVKPAGARGNSVAKGRGSITIVRFAGARGRVVAKGGGSLVHVRTAGARGNSVARGRGIGRKIHRRHLHNPKYRYSQLEYGNIDAVTRRANVLERYFPAPEAEENIWLLTNGTVTTRQPPLASDYVKVWYGGHVNEVTEDEAAILEAAGFTVERV